MQSCMYGKNKLHACKPANFLLLKQPINPLLEQDIESYLNSSLVILWVTKHQFFILTMSYYDTVI